MWRMMFVAAAAAAQPAVAAPTYLTCTIEVDGKPLPVALLLDEAAQRAVISFSDDQVGRPGIAVFSPTEVRISDRFYTWTINRVSLDMKRVAVIGDKRWEKHGKCIVAKPPANRAF